MREQTSEETIRRALAPYELGPKLKRMRLRKKIGLKDLARHTGLSASLLSQLENGKMVPTLPTLVRIAMVFDAGLEQFFCDATSRRPFITVRAEERLIFPERPDLPSPSYFFQCLAYPAQGKGFQAYHAEFPRSEGQQAPDHFHEGFEFLHVIDGTLSVGYRGRDEILNTGDSAYFNASEPHHYSGRSDPPARAVVITLPPVA